MIYAGYFYCMKLFLQIRTITYLYLLFLFLGAVLPLTLVSSTLSNNYTFEIRWDYLLHALVYMPLPVVLGLFLKKDPWYKNSK